MIERPTRITSLDVYPCHPFNAHDSVIGAALEEFCQVINEAAQLLSWYLREAGGIPANHSFLRIIVHDEAAEVEERRTLSPIDWDFETMDALADWSILYRDGDEQEGAALAWIHSAVRAQATLWGSSTDRLDNAFSAALALDPNKIKRAGQEFITGIGDDPSMPESTFWSLIDLLDGKADDAGCERLKRELSSSDGAAIDAFERLLYTALATLDTSDHRDPPVQDEVPIESELTFSDDTFLYVRCDVVASGRDTWLYVANNPAAMAQPWDICSERLLTVVPSLRA